MNLGLQCYIFAQYYTSHQLNIQTLIFDLGGVIIDLHEQATIEAFVTLTGQSPENVIGHYQNSSLFKKHEKGLITDAQFRDGIRKLMNVTSTDQQIDDAWNSMLMAIPIERLHFLNKLRKKYHVLILSNTNSIHENAFTKILQDVSGKPSIHYYADQVFYSHEIHMRKPDQEIYQFVIDDSKIDPKTTLFLDDKKENLLGAKSVGIQTKHITRPNQIFEIE